MVEEIKQIKIYAELLQRFLCAYGTKNGDNRTCDCKYSKKAENMRFLTENGGCAEARGIIFICDKLIKNYEKSITNRKITY